MQYEYKCWECEVDIAIERPMGKAPKKTRCPECNTTMRPKSVFLDTITECPRGDFSINGNIYGDTDRIKLLIHDNLERELKRVLEETNQT